MVVVLVEASVKLTTTSLWLSEASYVPWITTPLPEVTKSLVEDPLSPSILLISIFGGVPNVISPEPSIVNKAF